MIPLFALLVGLVAGFVLGSGSENNFYRELWHAEQRSHWFWADEAHRRGAELLAVVKSLPKRKAKR